MQERAVECPNTIPCAFLGKLSLAREQSRVLNCDSDAIVYERREVAGGLPPRVAVL